MACFLIELKHIAWSDKREFQKREFQERISTPGLNNVGFFEDYFDGNNETLSQFWHVVNKRLSEAA
jgi:hypothetical protein